MKRALLVGVLVVTMALPCVGATQRREQEPPKTIKVYGPGLLSCGRWVEERKKGATATATFMEFWLLGWVSAAGYYTKGLPPTDSSAMFAWMDKYCAEYPLEQFALAATDLVVDLQYPK